MDSSFLKLRTGVKITGLKITGVKRKWGEIGIKIETPKRVFSCNLVYSGASERYQFSTDIIVVFSVFSRAFRCVQA